MISCRKFLALLSAIPLLGKAIPNSTLDKLRPLLDLSCTLDTKTTAVGIVGSTFTTENFATSQAKADEIEEFLLAHGSKPMKDVNGVAIMGWDRPDEEKSCPDRHPRRNE